MPKIIALAVVALLLAVPTALAADGLPRGYSADAFFLTQNDECTATAVFVSPVTGKDVGSGRLAGGTTNVQIDVVDTCENVVLSHLINPVPIELSADEFVMGVGLNKAEMHTAATVCDTAGNCSEVVIDLEWRRVTPPTENCNVETLGDVRTTFCLATVTGTVVLDGVNLTPEAGTGVFQEHQFVKPEG